MEWWRGSPIGSLIFINNISNNNRFDLFLSFQSFRNIFPHFGRKEVNFLVVGAFSFLKGFGKNLNFCETILGNISPKILVSIRLLVKDFKKNIAKHIKINELLHLVRERR